MRTRLRLPQRNTILLQSEIDYTIRRKMKSKTHHNLGRIPQFVLFCVVQYFRTKKSHWYLKKICMCHQIYGISFIYVIVWSTALFFDRLIRTKWNSLNGFKGSNRPNEIITISFRIISDCSEYVCFSYTWN